MSEYLKNLPEGASLGFIFDDLYDRAEDLIIELEAESLGTHGEAGGPEVVVPDTDLSLRWTHAETNDSGVYFAKHVLANIEGTNHQLMSTMSFCPSPGLDSEPAAVNANRGDEAGSDYLLRRQTADQSDSGAITIALQGKGVEGHTTEPTGHTARPPEMPVAVLLAREGIESTKRLEIVTQGILTGMEMVEIIRSGTPAIDAFTVMGRPVANAA
ncbi:MAG TPA: hypothetical protein VFX79_00760 [Candidatus Saccharimonadales bacterium]|nr:hypothetical protein [Candidatus Saccharimonadales bacterium]